MKSQEKMYSLNHTLNYESHTCPKVLLYFFTQEISNDLLLISSFFIKDPMIITKFVGKNDG